MKLFESPHGSFFPCGFILPRIYSPPDSTQWWGKGIFHEVVFGREKESERGGGWGFECKTIQGFFLVVFESFDSISIFSNR